MSKTDEGAAAARVEMASQGGATPSGARASAQYIADMTRELAALARDGKLEFLAHLLDIAQLEAANTERQLAFKSRRS